MFALLILAAANASPDLAVTTTNTTNPDLTTAQPTNDATATVALTWRDAGDAQLLADVWRSPVTILTDNTSGAPVTLRGAPNAVHHLTSALRTLDAPGDLGAFPTQHPDDIAEHLAALFEGPVIADAHSGYVVMVGNPDQFEVVATLLNASPPVRDDFEDYVDVFHAEHAEAALLRSVILSSVRRHELSVSVTVDEPTNALVLLGPEPEVASLMSLLRRADLRLAPMERQRGR